MEVVLGKEAVQGAHVSTINSKSYGKTMSLLCNTGY